VRYAIQNPTDDAAVSSLAIVSEYVFYWGAWLTRLYVVAADTGFY
jgi:hypothetical protein